ncbi:MAG: 3-deoxy-7-phosphoheptulonate synthase [Patescibacteria group bacterium]
MRRNATPDEIAAVEARLHTLSYETGKLVGTKITLIGVYGDISLLPTEEIFEMAGVESLIPISRQYKRAAQKGGPTHPVYVQFPVGNVLVGNNLVIIAGPCSVESKAQIMESAGIVKEAGCHILRGGVVKYRSGPYSDWEGLGARSKPALRDALRILVEAGKAYDLPVVTEILDQEDLHRYEDAGVDCLQIGEPNSRNTALLNRLRDTELPVIHKRGMSLDIEAYLLWVERMMVHGKENIILCERGIASANRYTRNTLDLGGVAAFHYQLSGLPVAVDASHGCGIRDLVHPLTLAGIFAGASVLTVEAHPNPLVAKSDASQQLFPEQLTNFVRAANEAWKLHQTLSDLYVPSVVLEQKYKQRIEGDKQRFFGKPH